MRLSLTKPHTWHSLGPRTGNTGICPVLADVGFHGCPPFNLYSQQMLGGPFKPSFGLSGIPALDGHFPFVMLAQRN